LSILSQSDIAALTHACLIPLPPFPLPSLHSLRGHASVSGCSHCIHLPPLLRCVAPLPPFPSCVCLSPGSLTTIIPPCRRARLVQQSSVYTSGPPSGGSPHPFSFTRACFPPPYRSHSLPATAVWRDNQSIGCPFNCGSPFTLSLSHCRYIRRQICSHCYSHSATWISVADAQSLPSHIFLRQNYSRFGPNSARVSKAACM